MSEKTGAGTFRLPRPDFRNDPEWRFSFRRDEGRILGFSNPRDRVVLYDPIASENAAADFTLEHEYTHDRLTTNTTFGLFSQLMELLANRGAPAECNLLCHEAQWTVQELTAVYAEMCLVAVRRPALLAEAIAMLPTAVLEGPPYREAFESINQYLPVTTDRDPGELYAQRAIVIAIAGCSMNNDCLVRFRDPNDLDDRRLARYLKTESPNRRFERILDGLLVGDHLHQLVTSLVAHVGRGIEIWSQPERDPVGMLILEIPRLVSEVDCEGPELLKTQARDFQRRWSSIFSALGARSELKREDRVPFPQILTAPNQNERLRQLLPDGWTLTLPRLEAELEAARGNAEGVALTIKMNHAHRLIVDISRYPLADSVNPLMKKSAPRPALAFDWQTLTGPLNLGDVLAVLDTYPEFPHVVTFVNDSWRFWRTATQGRAPMPRAVKACAETELSLERLRGLLQFEELGRDAEYFITSIGPMLRVACFVNPRRPGAYALQRLPTDTSVNIFTSMADSLGVRHLGSPPGEHPHFPLLLFLCFGFRRE